MKNLSILLLSAIVFCVSSCKKSDDTSPTPTPTPTSPYYFKFTMGGTNYDFTADIPQYMPFYTNELGGYQVANANLFPSAGLRLSWPTDDTVRESDVTGLIGQTLYFDDNATIHPELSYDKDFSSDSWYSNDTTNMSYNVKISNVTFLKKDTVLGNALRTYVLTGTCSAVMSDGNETAVLSNGSFKFIVCRRDY